MPAFVPTMSTDQVGTRDSVPYWSKRIHRLLRGLCPDLSGDAAFAA